MKKYTLFFVYCLFSLLAVLVGSCQGSLEADPSQSARDVTALSPTTFGPDGNPPPPPLDPYGNPPPPPLDPYGNPPPPPPLDPYEFAALAQHVTVEQAKNSAHRTLVIVTGNLVQALGGDSYIFRDSSGTIPIRIGPREWQIYGSTISISDFIEISGEVCYGNGWEPVHVHARFIRKM
jgi:uncharacterized protein (TIGR00156 family)